ncbi:MAG: alpha/beta hydrolase family protein [Clostridiales bacterium]|nr:alpha/beta hydrolase family protein [Clostridiales bacterium]
MKRVEHVDKYYTCLESIQRKFDRFARKYPVQTDSIQAYEEWAAKARFNLEHLLGLDKMEDCNLDAQLLETTELEGKMKREKMIIQVEPGVYMPFYIIYPSKDTQKYIGINDNKKPACMIAPHGHQGGGKESIAGRREIPAISDAIHKFHYDYGMQLAKKGYITICPDARGYAERREQAFQKDEEASYLAGTCYHLAHMAEPLGMTIMGMLVWDLMRLVDYVYERDDFDVTELGFVGFSGGGMQTLYTAALDERIQKVVISGYLYGFRDSHLFLNGNCNCNYVPRLWEYYDCGDIGSLLCPRQVIIQSCKEDHLNGPRGLANVFEQLEIMNDAYALYQAQDNLKVDLREGGHCFHPEVIGII